MISLFDHQKEALKNLKTGSILCGGVGSGKSITAISYYYTKECGGTIKVDEASDFSELAKPKDLYIITTARKRDSLDWESECARFMLTKAREDSISGVKITVDSWNNITKYIDVKDAFFIFDEQRLIGSGTWVKSFIKIAKTNNWILLSATPGDTWLDYIPVFVANGFYKNRTEFIRTHVVYNNFTKFPKVERYVGEIRLSKLKHQILVVMPYEKATIPHHKSIMVEFDKSQFDKVHKHRWNPFTNEPIQNAAQLGYLMRRVVNSDPRRLAAVKDLLEKHRRLIIFYNFDYELELLKSLKVLLNVTLAEYNGHLHEPVPETESWIYLVQYFSGSEAWNCITANTILFYSLSYSYRMMIQAAGRIDRLNTPFLNLYYYYFKSNSMIDKGIGEALKNKKNFNERKFIKKAFNFEADIQY